MKRFASFSFVVLFLVVQKLSAETGVNSSTPTRSNTNSSTNSNINQTAKQTSGSASTTMIANGIAAAGFFAVCADGQLYMCAVGAATVAQALLMGGGAKNADQVDRATVTDPTTGYGGYNPGVGVGTTESANGFDAGSGGNFAELQALEQKFENKGYKVSSDGKSMSLPDGRTVSTAALASGSVPGYEPTASDRQQIAAITEDAMKKASGNRVIAVGTEEGGGGSRPTSSQESESSGSRFNMGAYLKSLNSRDPSSVNGLSKKLGEDNIGIKSDNIFEMVSREYKRQQPRLTP